MLLNSLLSSPTASSPSSSSITSPIRNNNNYQLVNARGFEHVIGFYFNNQRSAKPDPMNPGYVKYPEAKKSDVIQSNKPDCFYNQPRTLAADAYTDAELSEHNDKPVVDHLENLVEGSKEEHWFGIGFPTVLNLAEKIHYRTLHFTLPSDDMKNSDVFEMLKRDECITLTLKGGALADEENMIGNRLARFHWKVLHIKLTEEVNNLLGEFNVQLTTSIPSVVQQESKLRQEWISAKGICNSVNAKGINTSVKFNYITVPGTRSSQAKALYIADEALLNSVDARWLDIDETQFQTTLSSYTQGQYCMVPLPDSNRYIAENPVQFLVVSEFKRIMDLCAAKKLDKPEVITSSGRSYAKVPVQVVLFLADQKWNLYKKSSLLMNAEEFQLTLTPVNEKWKQEFESMVTRLKANGNHARFMAQFVMDLEIAYENYTGNTRTVKADFGGLLSPINNNNNSSSSSYQQQYQGNNNNINTSSKESFSGLLYRH